MLSYAALRQICKQREGHKLDEWREFISWAAKLLEGWMITGVLTVHQKDAYQDETTQYAISFTPDTIKVGHDGEFLLLIKGHTLATVDFEAAMARQWEIEDHFGWLDNDMLYTVSNGDLIVYDFDGLNRRVIAHNVSSHFPVAITNDKWLYYFSDDNLVREWLIAK